MNFFARLVLIGWVLGQGLAVLPAYAQAPTPPENTPEVIAPSQPTTPRRNSNTGNGHRGASAPTTAAAATSDSCAFNGVHDPFCNTSISEIIGRLVQFMLGAAGALFLAMFVYGGAVWLTAGSSDRHEQARKTLLNATAGVLIVIGSYTMIALLLRFVGGLGAAQEVVAPTNEIAADGSTTPGGAPGAQRRAGLGGLLEGAGTSGDTSVRGDASSGGASGGGACNAASFVTACQADCSSPLVALAGRTEECNARCDSFGPLICSRVRTPADCGPGCISVCASPEIPDLIRGMCMSECGGLCAAAFR